MYIIDNGQQFNPNTFKTWTKEKFFKCYAGVVKCDLASVWNQIELANGTSSESDKEIRIEHEGNNAQKVDAVSVPKRRIQKANNRPKHN